MPYLCGFWRFANAYHNKIVNEVESDLQDVIKECHMVSREEIEKERKSVRILQKVLRLIAPVM